MIAWVYGSGFPKSLDVSKAIDKAAGAEREVVGSRIKAGIGGSQTFAQDAWTQANRGPIELDITAPATEAARQWQGWGTALKPALEPITVARKPLAGTVAANVLEHGTGALNVDGCRVASDTPIPVMKSTGGRKFEQTHTQPNRKNQQVGVQELGRWPANLIHDGSEEIDFVFSGGASDSSTLPDLNRQVSVGGRSSSPARFFYCAKASKRDRDEGCEGMEARARKAYSGPVTSDPRMTHKQQRLPSRNHHPTVKPTDLMRYLCRLVTPPGRTVLDPFMGSGSTGKAAVLEGFNFIGIEREAEYVEIAKARIAAIKTASELPLFAA
jgi:site-specific DNA-methyltransferase (adenine-specific)